MKNFVIYKNLKKAILTGFMSVLLFFATFTFAGEFKNFIISTDPETFDTNESVDLTIKAVDKDGNVVKNYKGMVMIGIEELLDEEDLYELPTELYTFEEEDQGVKVWSKGLKVREEGKYNLYVESLEESIKATNLILVGDGELSGGDLKGTIEIISPASGTEITTSDLNILGKSDITNTTLQFFLNDEQLKDEAKTDVNGNFNIFIKGLKEGKNTLTARLVNINGELLAKSDEIPFEYKPVSTDDQYKGLEISPSKEINLGDKLKFDVKVGDAVNSVELKIGDGTELIGIFPMDKVDNNHFTKTAAIENDGQHLVSVNLILQGGERKSYKGVEIINVSSQRTKPMDDNSGNDGANTISNLKVVRDSVVKSKITVSWNSSGNPYSYEVKYGNQRGNLINSQKTASNEINIGNLNPNDDYYVQVVGLDKDGNVVGNPSDIVGTTTSQNGSAGEGSCSVGGITVSTVKIGNQSYLTRGNIPGASKYIVSRSEGSTNLQKVGETTDTKYAYPFDPNSEKKYAYYSVTAICNDGQKVQIGGAKKVVVGPAENILIVIFISVILYFGYKKFVRV